MRHTFVPHKNSVSPLNCEDYGGHVSKVKAGDDVWISVVFKWDMLLAESMGQFYKSIGASVQIGGPAYGDPGAEFIPGLFTAPGITITSRGCVRNCPWCYVPKREGQKIRHLEVKEGNILQDNNILACNNDHRARVYQMLRKQKAVSLRGGLDARLLRDSDIDEIRSLKLFDLWTAYDDKENKTASISAIGRLRAAGIPQSKLRCYVLIGFGNETRSEAEGRLFDCYMAGALPFAQLYDGNKSEGEEHKEWKRLARRWCLPAITKAEAKRLMLNSLGDLI